LGGDEVSEFLRAANAFECEKEDFPTNVVLGGIEFSPVVFKVIIIGITFLFEEGDDFKIGHARCDGDLTCWLFDEDEFEQSSPAADLEVECFVPGRNTLAGFVLGVWISAAAEFRLAFQEGFDEGSGSFGPGCDVFEFSQVVASILEFRTYLGETRVKVRLGNIPVEVFFNSFKQSLCEIFCWCLVHVLRVGRESLEHGLCEHELITRSSHFDSLSIDKTVNVVGFGLMLLIFVEQISSERTSQVRTMFQVGKLLHTTCLVLFVCRQGYKKSEN
jgi:hypothetical protein